MHRALLMFFTHPDMTELMVLVWLQCCSGHQARIRICAIDFNSAPRKCLSLEAVDRTFQL